MEDIKLYYASKGVVKHLLFILVVAGGIIYSLIHAEDAAPGIGTWTLLALLVLIGVFTVYYGIKKGKNGKPVLTVRQDRVILHGIKDWEIHYSDVEAFFLSDDKDLLLINYKENVAHKKMADASASGRIVRKFSRVVIGSEEGLPASDLNLKPDELLNLMEERLNAYREKQQEK